MMNRSLWPRAQHRSRARRPHSFRPTLEALEDRITPTGTGWAIDADPQPTSNSINNWGLALDGNNNSIITGPFTGTTTFGSTTLTSAGGSDAYVAKYGPSGSLLWAERFGGAGNDSANRVATDASGNIYVAGYFSDTVTFSPTITLTSAGEEDAFIAKLDPSGNVLWVSQLGGASNDEGWGVPVDGSDNVYATGFFNGTANVSLNGVSTGLTLNPIGGQGQDAFVMKLDSVGNPVWAKSIGSGNDDWGLGVAVDPNGNVYADGRFSGTASFGTYSLTSKSTNGTNTYVTQLDASGNFLWAQRMGGEGDTINQAGYGIALDTRSTDPSTWAVYVTGVMNGNNCDFGSTTFTTYGTDTSGSVLRDDSFVTKLNAATGSFIWADQLGGAGQELAYAIAVDGSGNVYTAGGFGANTQPANFDPHGSFIMYPGNGTYSSPGNGWPAGNYRDAYISELDSNGNFLAAWQTTASASDHNTGTGIAVDKAGDLWTSGDFDVTTIFPTGQTLTITDGVSWVFVVRLNAPHGAAVGTVYADLNQTGAPAGNPPLAGWTVYADLDKNGVLDPGEPSAVTDIHGRYEIGGLAPGTYTIRAVPPAGWTTTEPLGGAYTVTVGNGFVRNDFGEYTPTTQTTYTQNKATTIKGRSTVQSTLSVSNSYNLLDVDVEVNISFSQDGHLSVYLIAPDGTTVPLAINNGGSGANFTNTIFDDEASASISSGTAPFSSRYQTVFGTVIPLAGLQNKNVKGTWTLEVYNNSTTTGKMNSWSLIATHTTNGNPLTATAMNTPSRQSTAGGTAPLAVASPVAGNSAAPVSGIQPPPSMMSGLGNASREEIALALSLTEDYLAATLELTDQVLANLAADLHNDPFLMWGLLS